MVLLPWFSVCLMFEAVCLGFRRRAEVPKLDTQVLGSLARKAAIILISTIYLVCVSVSLPSFPNSKRYEYGDMRTPLCSLE